MGKLLDSLTRAGPWPLVVLLLGLVALLLLAFYFLQRGRKKATLKIGIASFELEGQIEERPLRKPVPRGDGEFPPDPAAPKKPPKRKISFEDG